MSYGKRGRTGGSSGSDNGVVVTIPGFLPGTELEIAEHLLHENVFNVYVLDEDVTRIPQQMCDQHVKMAALDYPVILSTARHVYQPGWKGTPLARSVHLTPKYESHPIVKWVGHSLANYIYLYELTRGVWKEFSRRFLDNAPLAKYSSLLGQGVPSGISGFATKPTEPTPLPQMLPEIYRVASTIERFHSWTNLVHAYRDYYATEVFDYGVWTNTSIPSWLIERDLDYTRAHRDSMITRNVRAVMA